MRLAVVGDPIEHSRSPAIHTAALDHLGIVGTYVALRTPVDAFASVEAALRRGDLDGVNVTMPHKTNARQAVDDIDDAARRSGSVNTIVAHEGALRGANTDVSGMTFALTRMDVPTDAPVMVLGAGGAARAALVALEGRPITIAARSPERAAGALRTARIDGAVVPWGTVLEGCLVVNATPLGMSGEDLPDGIVEASIGLMDMVYGEDASPAFRRAHDAGVPAMDGIVMLVGQAAKAFTLFTGRPAPIDVMEAAARTR